MTLLYIISFRWSATLVILLANYWRINYISAAFLGILEPNFGEMAIFSQDFRTPSHYLLYWDILYNYFQKNCWIEILACIFANFIAELEAKYS
jgi:hypothetical protein